MLEFIQCTAMGDTAGDGGLFAKFLYQLSNLDLHDIFAETKVIVPNQAMAKWLKDRVALNLNICANIDFVTLLGPVIEKIYQRNNPDVVLLQTDTVKYIIYEYLCQSANVAKLNSVELNYYLLVADEKLTTEKTIDKFRAFQLSSQLEQIFHEYIYLRTEEMLNLERFTSMPQWQKLIVQHLLDTAIGEQKTFLDIYRYFNNLSTEQLCQLELPSQLFIFGLTSVYPSQLKLIVKLAQHIDIYWYYLACSNHYYGDLLDSKAKNKLERKLLRKPDLSLDDLFLTEGNPLLANLGQQSREFTELLIAHDIDANLFEPDNILTQPSTLLGVIQGDIQSLQQRISKDLRLQSNIDCYAEPITLDNFEPGSDNQRCIFDLANQQTSIKINSCHNKMREVQVAFNAIAEYLDKNQLAKWSDILVTAPDIDDYAEYIAAVFSNEWVTTSISGQQFKLQINITGNRRHSNYKILETLRLILNTPYSIPVSYLLELLTQAELQRNLEISQRELDLVRQWLFDNHTNFGYDMNDYNQYGYNNYSVHSFKQFLNNLVLGACIPNDVNKINAILPVYIDASDHIFTPYDNLDYSQIDLCNKLINLIDLLFSLRNELYVDQTKYKTLTVEQIHTLLYRLGTQLISDDDTSLIYAEFSGFTLKLNQGLELNLPILNLIIDEYIDNFRSEINLNSKITCASMQYMRNIPFDFIYVLGMNFGEFPAKHIPNQLSLLAHEWALADRNYNIEDKQAFLDIIIAAKQQIIFSYIGRRETDNKEQNPSPVLNLFMTTLGHGFTNFRDNTSYSKQQFNYRNIFCQQSLHPFYNNKQVNYSTLWYDVANSVVDVSADLRWNFKQLQPILLTAGQQHKYYVPNLHLLSNMFLYTNSNLYAILNISPFIYEIELKDTEDMLVCSKDVARRMYKELCKYSTTTDQEQLQKYLINKGILNYQHIGNSQFQIYYPLYQAYIAGSGHVASLCLKYTLHYLDKTVNLTITDTVMIEDDNIIVVDKFENITVKELVTKIDEINYRLRIQAMIMRSILSAPALQIFQHETQVVINNVIIRLFNLTGASRDFKVNMSGDAIVNLDDILSYYYHSLTNPVLVHKAAIESYASAKVADQDDAVFKAQGKFYADYKNFDLEQIRTDVVFASYADNYFEFVKQHNLRNDVFCIGDILARLDATVVGG